MTTVNVSPHKAHGPGSYKHCRHADCLAYRERFRKRWAYDRDHGILRTVGTEDARRRVDTLIGLGWSARAIAGAADVSPQVITRIRSGQATMTRKVADRILAIDVAQLPSQPSRATTEPFVPRVGATRRIQALLFMGWTHADLAARSGIKTSALLNQAGRWVTRTTHDRVAALYDDLAMKPGPSARTRSRAIARGYVGPLAWDDIDHDDVRIDDAGAPGSCDVDDVAIERRMAGDTSVYLNLAEKDELRRRWFAAGRTFGDLERVCGMSPVTRRQEAS